MDTLLIYGASGAGKEIADLAQCINQQNKRWNEICFIDDDLQKGKVFYARDVMSFEKAQELQKHKETECIISIGEPAIRQKLFDKCSRANFKMTTLIAPTAIVSGTAKIGKGVIISRHVFVSSDCEIGNNVLLQPTCKIFHDSVIKENSVISSFVAVAGNCAVGGNAYAGIGAMIREKVKIGDETIIVVVNDIPGCMIAIGNPARAIKPNENKRIFKGE